MKRILGAAAVAGVAVFGGAGAFDDNTTSNDQGEIVEGGGLGVMAMQIGDCMQLPSAETEIASVEAVPCAMPHDAQVFGKTVSSHVGPYDEEAVWMDGAESCIDNYFAAFVGVDYQSSELYVDALYPVAEGWAQGDREVICLLLPPTEGEQLVGDKRGSRE